MPRRKRSSSECYALYKAISEAETAIENAVIDVFEAATWLLCNVAWIAEIEGKILLLIPRIKSPRFIRVDLQALKKTRKKDRALVDRLFIGHTFEERWASYNAFQQAVDFLGGQSNCGLRYFERRCFFLGPRSVEGDFTHETYEAMVKDYSQ